MTSLEIDAVIFDAYGTLFDVASVRDVVAELTDDIAGFVAHWRRRQLDYTDLSVLC